MIEMVHSRLARCVVLVVVAVLYSANGLYAQAGQMSIDASVTVASDYVFR